MEFSCSVLTVALILAPLLFFARRWALRLSATQFRARYGPWAVVLGASVGLGRALSHRLAARGLNVVLVARNAERVRAAARELEEAFPGVQTRAISADLSRSDGVEAALKACADIDVGLVVHNACGTSTVPFVQSSLAEKLAVADVNVVSTTATCDLFGRRLLERTAATKGRRAGILLVSSLAGLVGAANVVQYAATKAFITALASGLWAEFRHKGVDVRSAVFGAVRTPNLLNDCGEKANHVPGIQEPDAAAEHALEAFNNYGPRHLAGWEVRVVSVLCERILPRSLGVLLVGLGTNTYV